MTIVVWKSGGINPFIEPAFRIFRNQYLKYPIRKVPWNIARVSCRTQPEGECTRRYFSNDLKNQKLLQRILLDVKGLYFRQLRWTFIKWWKRGETKYSQGTSSIFSPELNWPFSALRLIYNSKSKRVFDCTLGFEENRTVIELIMSLRKHSGKLLNPGKPFFLNLASQVV